MVWLVVHLVATAVLTGVAWASLGVIYPAFALVGAAEWPRYHAAHVRAITRVIVVPWVAQGVSTAALLLDPPDGRFGAAAVLAAFALAAVVLTFAGAVPAHNRLGDRGHRGRPHADHAEPRAPRTQPRLDGRGGAGRTAARALTGSVPPVGFEPTLDAV